MRASPFPFVLSIASALVLGVAPAAWAQGGGPPEEREDMEQYDAEREAGVIGRRNVAVPPGHLPPPGECKRWDPDLPPGQQPPPVPCESLIGAALGDDLIVTHTGAYDPDHDWDADEVPDAVWEILRGRR